MKKLFFVCLATLALFSANAQRGIQSDAKVYIDTTIVTNGANNITATKMRTALNKILQYAVDSVYFNYDTLIVTRGTQTIKKKLPGGFVLNGEGRIHLSTSWNGTDSVVSISLDTVGLGSSGGTASRLGIEDNTINTARSVNVTGSNSLTLSNSTTGMNLQIHPSQIGMFMNNSDGVGQNTFSLTNQLSQLGYSNAEDGFTRVKSLYADKHGANLHARIDSSDESFEPLSYESKIAHGIYETVVSSDYPGYRLKGDHYYGYNAGDLDFVQKIKVDSMLMALSAGSSYTLDETLGAGDAAYDKNIILHSNENGSYGSSNTNTIEIKPFEDDAEMGGGASLFLRTWTTPESYIKFFGTGIRASAGSGAAITQFPTLPYTDTSSNVQNAGTAVTRVADVSPGDDGNISVTDLAFALQTRGGLTGGSSGSSVGDSLANLYNGNATARSKVLGYFDYTVILNQTGTSAPTVTTLQDMFTGIVWTRTSAGTYVATKTGAFTVNKTWPLDAEPYYYDNGNKVVVRRVSADQMEVKTYQYPDYATPVDGILVNRLFTVQVYL